MKFLLYYQKRFERNILKMTPIGKLTLAIIGLRLFGATGFLWGMLLGHIIIDRSLVKTFIKSRLSAIDDNIRLMLPYRLYRVYNRIHDQGFGKIYGALLGGITYGWNGVVIFVIFGHYLFDSRNPYGKEIRYGFEDFWNRHLATLTGAIIGYTLKFQSLIFIGIVIGFFIDEYRLEKGFKSLFKNSKPFWSRLNIIKLALRSHTAKDTSFIQSMAGLCAKVAKADGVVTEHEIHMFKKLFNADRNPQIARIFNEAKQTTEGYEHYAKQLKILSQNNVEMKENIIENLFKIGIADGAIDNEELNLFDEVARIIELPQGNYNFIKDRYIAKPANEEISNDYEILGVFYNASNKEIKKRWIDLINEYHPDKIQAAGGSPKEIELATQKMAAINSAYEHIMKQRKAG